MAFAASTSLTRSLSRLFMHSNKIDVTSRSLNSLVSRKSQLLALGNRSLTRSFALLQSSKVPSSTKLTQPCGCCSMHTKGDQELSEFLTEEIALEKSAEKLPGRLPGIKGFQLAESNGSEVKLIKTNQGETVTVRFNVNHSVDDDAMPEEQTDEQSPPPMMTSKPAFVVEINKGGPKTLHIQCAFPQEDDLAQIEQEQKDYDDAIEIQEVTLVNAGEEWGEKEYIVSGSVMDGNLYDMMLTMMEERGIDGRFIDEFVTFTTAYEHRSYISFLEGLKDFASK